MSDHVRSPLDDLGARPAPAATRRLAGLEGPRGVACLCVIMVHVSVHFAPDVLAAARIDFLGQALTFFFVLSGFLLYLPYVERLRDRREMLNTPKYLLRRVLRVFPAYLVTFLIANFLLRAVYVENPSANQWNNADAGTGMITDPFQLIANLTLTQSLFPSTLQTGINPSWSLTTEFGFYLTLPVMAYVLFSMAKRSAHRLRAALWPPVLLLVVGILTNAIVAVWQGREGLSTIDAYWGPYWIAVLSRSFFGLADTFAFGMVAAVVYAALCKNALSTMSTRRLQWIFAAAMVVGLLVSIALFVFNPRHLATAVACASAAFILMVITPLARGEHSTLATITDWRPIRVIGIISLSAYLWHYPIIILVDRVGLPIPTGPIGLVIGFLVVSSLTIAAGLISYRFVEAPAMKFRA